MHTSRVEVLQDPIINGVQVLNIERREGQRVVELLGKKTFPSVITHEHHSFACAEIHTF